jgi:uncharacterized protein
MEYVTFGKTGRRVSRIGFGGATAGLKNYVHSFDPDKKEDREPIIAAIRRGAELGINYFDTAASYGDGKSEQIFGEALAGIDPSTIFLATKCATCEAGEARRSVERSLTNLRREAIDLLQIHGTVYTEKDADTILKRGGMLGEMAKMRNEGLIRHLGFTVEAQNKTTYRLIKSGLFDMFQVSYNLIFQHPYDPSWKSGSLYDAEEAGMGIAAMRTVTSGIFQKWVQMVNPSNTFNYNPALIQFTLSNPLVDVVLLGMRTVAHVEENVRICADLSGRIDLEALHKRYV